MSARTNVMPAPLWGRRPLVSAALLGLSLLGIALGLWWLLAGSQGASAGAEAARRDQLRTLSGALTRVGTGAGVDTTVDVVFATPEYLRLMGRREDRPEETLVFYVSEENHASLPRRMAPPLLRFLGSEFSPATIKVLADSDHHRTSVVTYRLEGSLAHVQHLPGRLEMELAPGSVTDGAASAVSWDVPIAAQRLASGEGGDLRLSGVAVLGLFGGLLASMWPCLFQLTAYFIPSLAGLSMAEARQGAAPQVRRQVLRTAIFFVLGIVMVYTAAGAVAGYAAESLSGTLVFEEWRRPVTLVAALFIIAMALRVAIRARAPLVCKMPLASHLGSSGPTSPLGTMALGLAFATGCMTCFGAATALGMLTYVVSSASALTGAVTLFIFSLGIAIPLVVAAVAMARVLPLLGRLERIAPWMGLASAAIMITFALLLVSDQYHVVSNWILRAAGA